MGRGFFLKDAGVQAGQNPRVTMVMNGRCRMSAKPVVPSVTLTAAFLSVKLGEEDREELDD